MGKKLSEQQVANAFVLLVATEARQEWPRLYAFLKGIERRFELSGKDIAAFDLALAAIALGLQAVKNLFPAQQAERIRQWVFQAVDTEDWGAYGVSTLNEYIWAFDRGLAMVDSGGDPLSAISSRLLDRWLGEDIKRLEVKIEGTGTGVVSPLLIGALNASLGALATSWSWKTVREKFDIAPASPPPPSEGSQNDSRLRQFLESAADKPYLDLITYHMKRQSSAQLRESLLGECTMLPTYLQPHVEYWMGYSCGALASNRAFWASSNYRQAFERIMGLANETLPLRGQIDCVEDFAGAENQGLAFQLFQIVTLNLAYLASTQRPLRAMMGIRKGLFG